MGTYLSEEMIQKRGIVFRTVLTQPLTNINEPAHEILALFVLRGFVFQIRMRSHPVGLGVWFLVWPFVCFRGSCVRTARALAGLVGLVACAVGAMVSGASSNVLTI